MTTRYQRRIDIHDGAMAWYAVAQEWVQKNSDNSEILSRWKKVEFQFWMEDQEVADAERALEAIKLGKVTAFPSPR